jgi:hypothetical protein
MFFRKIRTPVTDGSTRVQPTESSMRQRVKMVQWQSPLKPEPYATNHSETPR